MGLEEPFIAPSAKGGRQKADPDVDEKSGNVNIFERLSDVRGLDPGQKEGDEEDGEERGNGDIDGPALRHGRIFA
jgi:hypothetical protein